MKNKDSIFQFHIVITLIIILIFLMAISMNKSRNMPIETYLAGLPINSMPVKLEEGQNNADVFGRGPESKICSGNQCENCQCDIKYPITIKEYEYNGKTFKVIRDDLLEVGTKQRVAKNYCTYLVAHSETPITHLLYTGTYNGFGPVALAWGANQINIKATVVLSLEPVGYGKKLTKELAELTKNVKLCRKYGAEVLFVNNWKEINQMGAKLSEQEGWYWVPLGFDDETFIRCLAYDLTKCINLDNQDEISNLNGSNIWMVGGSGTIARAYSLAYPNSTIYLIPAILKQINKLENKCKKYKNIKIIQHHSKKLITPYPTVENYDSIAWDTAVALGKTGDYILNVASFE